MRRCAFAVALALAATGSAAQAPERPDVSIFLPRFAANGSIGANVTATINLAVWRTLRRTPWPNPGNQDFGSGLVIWSDETLPADAARAAAATLRENHDLDMILWGSAAPLGADVLVQAYLLARPPGSPGTPENALWRVTRGNRTLTLGMPRQLFVLGSVPLRNDLIARFNSAAAVRFCPTKTRDCSGPPVGPRMQAIQHDGPWTLLVTPDRRRGWTYLYEIGGEPNEIASFTGALISYYRGDWEQAARLFAGVGRTAAANAAVREDAAMLRAAALSRAGQPAAAAIDAVRRADPYASFALQVAAMDALHSDAPAVRRHALAAALKNGNTLFDPDDPWPRTAAAMLEQ